MFPVPELAKSDPFWFQQDPHRAAHGRLTLLGPTMPLYEVYNPAIAQFNADHAFSIAEYDVMKGGDGAGTGDRQGSSGPRRSSRNILSRKLERERSIQIAFDDWAPPPRSAFAHGARGSILTNKSKARSR